MNRTSDGSTSQKMPLAKFGHLAAASPVSAYSQTIASNEVSGSEASTAPSSELRLATSEMATTSTAVTAILMAVASMPGSRSAGDDGL